MKNEFLKRYSNCKGYLWSDLLQPEPISRRRKSIDPTKCSYSRNHSKTTMAISEPLNEQYGGKVTAIGNLKEIRLDAAFFKAHPEFNGEVRAMVLTDGQVLLSVKTVARRAPINDDVDLVMLGFLRFLENKMARHPELIEPADRAQLRRIGKLVKGVKVE